MVPEKNQNSACSKLKRYTSAKPCNCYKNQLYVEYIVVAQCDDGFILSTG